MVQIIALGMAVDTGLARNACRRMNVQPGLKGNAHISSK